MRAEVKFKLTPAGFCVNPACGRQLYLELMIWPDDEVCYECVPPDGKRPPMVLLQGGLSERESALSEASRLDKHMLRGHCTEACCNSPVGVARHRFLALAGMVACVVCGNGLPKESMTWTPAGYRCRDNCPTF